MFVAGAVPALGECMIATEVKVRGKSIRPSKLTEAPCLWRSAEGGPRGARFSPAAVGVRLVEGLMGWAIFLLFVCLLPKLGEVAVRDLYGPF